jgi:hypothetical protein
VWSKIITNVKKYFLKKEMLQQKSDLWLEMAVNAWY